MVRHFVRLRGVMRSGTNLVAWMLRHNFEDTVPLSMVLGWKHGPLFQDARALDLETCFDPRWLGVVDTVRRTQPDVWHRFASSDLVRDATAAFVRGEVSTVICTRAPSKWYSSCLRIERDLPGFIPHGLDPAAAAAHWNESHRQWLGALPARGLVLDADRLRADPETMLTTIGTAFPELARTSTTQVTETYLLPGSEDEIWPELGRTFPRWTDDDATTARTPEPSDPAVMNDFRAGLDPDILAALGYADGRLAARGA